jgi:hypothetical protein
VFPILPETRKLFTNLGMVWASLHNHDGDGDDDEDQQHNELQNNQKALRHSRLYRAVLGAQIEDLQLCVRERRDTVSGECLCLW